MTCASISFGSSGFFLGYSKLPCNGISKPVVYEVLYLLGMYCHVFDFEDSNLQLWLHHLTLLHFHIAGYWYITSLIPTNSYPTSIPNVSFLATPAPYTPTPPPVSKPSTTQFKCKVAISCNLTRFSVQT
jgi:hypothetical protein